MIDKIMIAITVAVSAIMCIDMVITYNELDKRIEKKKDENK